MKRVACVTLGVLVLCVFAGSGQAAIVGPLVWQKPVLVDPPAPNAPLVDGLFAISCSTERLCVAVDSSGNAVSSGDPAGGKSAWKVTHIEDDASLRAVSCSASVCAALDTAGNVLTTADPLTGTWHATAIGRPNGPTAVSCPSPSLCLVAADGNVLSSANPTSTPPAWQTMPVDSDVCQTDCYTSSAVLTALSCPAVSLCVATDNTGHVLASAQPTGDASSWSSTAVDTHVFACRIGGSCQLRLDSLSCPTSGFCAVADSVGNVISTTNPRGNASAWTSRQVVHGTPAALSCASSRRCVALDAWDARVSDTPQQNTAWSSRTIDRGGQLNDVSCPSMLLCVAVDRAGNIFVARAKMMSRSHVRELLKTSLRAASHMSVSFAAPTSGVVDVRWLTSSSRGSRVVAQGHRNFAAAGTSPIQLHLSRYGKSLLKTHRRLHLTARATITPPGNAAVTATRALALSR